jgi:hypothetical protein
VCGADLSLFYSLDATADAWFNLGLEAIAASRPGRALEWISACCAARPTDVAAIRVQAKLWAQLGHVDEARAALARAAQLDPDAPELEPIRQALEECLVASTAKIPPGKGSVTTRSPRRRKAVKLAKRVDDE